MLKTSNSLGTSSSFLRAYQQYIESDVRAELLEEIMAFDDFSSYGEVSKECLKIIQGCNRSFPTASLSTNGSVGDPRNYEFSDFAFWRLPIERFLRGHDGFTVLHLYDRPFFTRTSLTIFPCDGNKGFNVSLINDFLVDDLFEAFELEPYPISLNASPNVWLYITTSPTLRERFNFCDKIQRGVNTDWDRVGQFQQLRFPVKDQMIDWYTGLNFYTCSADHRHVLPIFCQTEGVCKNILNLATLQPHKCDDYFEIKDVVRCDCGRNRPVFDFKGHCKNWIPINHDLISQLRDTYYSFQVFLIGGRVNIFRICKGEIRDTGLIESVYPDCIFHDNEFARVGAKLYNFWNPEGCLWSIGSFGKIGFV